MVWGWNGNKLFAGIGGDEIEVLHAWMGKDGSEIERGRIRTDIQPAGRRGCNFCPSAGF